MVISSSSSWPVSGSNTHLELSCNPISAYFGPSFVEEYQIPPFSNSLNPTTPYTDMLEITKDIPTKHGLCNTVLKYINRVLMEDDFEDDNCTIKGPNLESTKRSYQEIFVGDKRHYDEINDLVKTDMKTENNKLLAAEDSTIMHDTLGKIVLLYGKDEEFTSRSKYTAFPRKGIKKREAIAIRNLLFQCMESVAISDHRTSKILMKEIRSKSCAYGHGTERLVHYFADGLQARLEGGLVQKHRTLAVKTLSDADLLKAFKLYFTEFPFLETAYFFTNQMIMDLIENSTDTLHIIHFGIMHGLQWPPLIQRLAKRPGGPPKLRITGIDFPQQGLRPDARVKETGIQLTSYCKEFNVPFEYTSFAQSWDMVKLEDLKIKKGEVVVATCMFHFMYLLDDSVMEQSPRDNALKLIKKINPDIFIHVIVNGTYNSPFFVSRFKEALFHYASWFEMFDAIFPLESPERMIFEREVWGREILNIVVSEGFERAERPETYKQWQKRTTRAGFKPIPLNPKIVSDIRARVQSCYHKNFFIEEAGNWLLDGWKGRALFALSCWKPA